MYRWFLFFFKQKTAYEMRISDWSSTCALPIYQVDRLDAVGAFIDRQDAGIAVMLRRAGLLDEAHAAMDLHAHGSDLAADIGGPGFRQRGDRKRVVKGKSVSVRVGTGGRRSLENKNN